MTEPKIALVYDRVNTPYGGAEKLLLALHEIFPNAPLYTSVYDEQLAPWAKVFTVKTSWINKFSWLRNKHQHIAFLMPLAFESFNFSEFDLVISVSSAEAKGVITKPETKHLCYLLTPPRYLYSHRDFIMANSIVFNLPIINLIAKKLLSYLTRWDQIAIHRPDQIIPISKLVKNRVMEYYGVECNQPIYPSLAPQQHFVKSNFKKENAPLLIVSRLVPYKNIDLAIRACQELDQPLNVVGRGESEEHFKELVTKPHLIKFYKNLDDKRLDQMYDECSAVLMPGEEDFGIVALEALTHSKPVLINANSGASELIEDKKSGLLLKRLDLEGLKSAILEVKKYDFDPAIMSRCLKQHNEETFKKQFKQAVFNALKES